MRALWMVAALIGIAILTFAHATVLGIVVGIAFLGLAVFLYRRPLVHRMVSVTGSSIATRFLGVLATVTRSGPEGSELMIAWQRAETVTPLDRWASPCPPTGGAPRPADRRRRSGAAPPSTSWPHVKVCTSAALRLLIAEVDREQRPLAADRAGRRFRLAHSATVHPGRRYV